MSIPRDILDQLLSGYLDDVLSGDEQERIDQLLRDDQSIASELEDLRRMRGSLRQISRADAHVRLDDGFADRVMQAAVAQATTEGLRDDHPLLKVAGHPDTPSRSRRLPMAKITGAVVALAASISLGIVMLQPPTQPIGIARNTLQDTPSPIDLVDATESSKQDPTAEGMTDKMVAVATKIEQSLDPDGPVDVVEAPQNPAKSSTEPMLAATGETKAAEPPKHAVAASTNSKLPTEAEAAALLGESNVLTILVNRTEAGRQSRAVRNAMRGAAIDSAVSKELTEAMVSAVTHSLKNDGSSTSATQILFLEVPAKKVDVFYARLMADEQGIESVGLGMVATPEVRRFVQSLSPDAVRDIRHSQTWELQGNQVGRIADQLASGQTFLSTKSIRGIPLTSAANSDGPDQLARILILIQ